MQEQHKLTKATESRLIELLRERIDGGRSRHSDLFYLSVIHDMLKIIEVK